MKHCCFNPLDKRLITKSFWKSNHALNNGFSNRLGHAFILESPVMKKYTSNQFHMPIKLRAELDFLFLSSVILYSAYFQYLLGICSCTQVFPWVTFTYFKCFHFQTLLRTCFPFLFFSLLKRLKAFQKFPVIQSLLTPIKIAQFFFILTLSTQPQSPNVWKNRVLLQTV